VNPWAEEVWDYHIELAREAVELGFPEIQWDYVRFPDRPASEMAAAVFPGGEGKRRSQAIRAFLKRARAELADLDVPLTADVFGVAASVDRDVGIGQLWEDIVDVVDATLPMIYPSHYWAGSFGFQSPNDYPYEVVAAATRDALRRTEGVEGAGRIIPWLQSFTLGPPAYAAPEIRAQIQAVYDQGIGDWILWNSAGRYPEDAFEPVGGWDEAEEPLIRVAGRLLHPDLRFAPPELPSAPDTVGLGHAIADYIASQPHPGGGRYGNVEEYGGHGIGTEMHMEPHVHNHGKAGKGDPNRVYLLRTFGREGHEIWEVTDPSKPKVLWRHLGMTDTHKNYWECEGGIAYIVSRPKGWRARIVEVFDLSDPSKPVKIRDFGLPGQEPGAHGAVPVTVHGMVSTGPVLTPKVFLQAGTFSKSARIRG
jgi:hypothetical protein